jgi:hypothetical protein
MTVPTVPAAIARLVARATRPPVAAATPLATHLAEAASTFPNGPTTAPPPRPEPPARLAAPGGVDAPAAAMTTTAPVVAQHDRTPAGAIEGTSPPSVGAPATPVVLPAAAAHLPEPTRDVRIGRVPFAVPVVETVELASSERVAVETTPDVVRAARASDQVREMHVPAAVAPAPTVAPPTVAPPTVGLPTVGLPTVGSSGAAAPRPGALTTPTRAEPAPVPPAPPVPPVQIGRIEVHVAAPAGESDPFAGCRALEGGLTANHGGGW